MDFFKASNVPIFKLANCDCCFLYFSTNGEIVLTKLTILFCSSIHLKLFRNYGEYAPDGAINLANILAPYMKTAKNCGTEEGCWYGGNTYKMDGTIYREAERPDMSKVLLQDGTAIAFGGTDYSIATDKDKLSWILVDINGRK